VEIMLALKRRGLPMLLVEQNFAVCRAVADRHAILDEGRIVWTGDNAALAGADAVIERHLTLERSGTRSATQGSAWDDRY
jgi:branched-chain amino acid transport system ATP-binding protein